MHPPTYKAAQYTSEDVGTDTDCITIVELPLAAPLPNQLCVRVTHAAINPVDIKVFSGTSAAQPQPVHPFTPGYDYSGTVHSVGPAVTDFKVGDKVWGVNWGNGNHGPDGGEGCTVGGSFAEYILLPAHKVSRLPDGLDPAIAAAVALVGTTAHQSLFQRLQIEAGHRVLVLGGAGAVGAAAIQLAKERGAWVATTASSRTLEYVQGLGPDRVVNYSECDWSQVTELKEMDAVFDAIGETDGEARAGSILKEGGRFVTIATKSLNFFCLSNDAGVQDDLAKLIVQGKLKVPINRRFEFTDEGVRAMFRTQREGKSLGKNVLQL